MPRFIALATGSLLDTSKPHNFDFTRLNDDIAKQMKLDETRARLSQNKQDAAKLLKASVRAQTKRIAAGAWD